MSFDSSSPPEDSASDVSDEKRHEILSEPRRRRVLEALVGTDEEVVDFEAVVQAVADAEAAEAAPHEEHRRSVALSLHHFHLPQMDEANVVDFDHADGTVRYLEDERLERLLEV